MNQINKSLHYLREVIKQFFTCGFSALSKESFSKWTSFINTDWLRFAILPLVY